MKIAIVYDCLFPNTIGGAERWYRSLAERLGKRHQVTYLTRRQWGEGGPGTPFEAVGVSPGGALYARSGRRRICPPIRFGVGVFRYLLSKGRSYDAVHCASFPFFSVLAAWLALRLTRSRARLIVDWHEVWGAAYWRSYLGPVGGRIGFWVEHLCTRLPDHSFTFSRLATDRLRELGHRAPVLRLTGEHDEDPEQRARLLRRSREGPPSLVFAGRHIPEKRVTAVPPAAAAARAEFPDLQCVILGDGPETDATRAMVRELGLEQAVEMAGSVEPDGVAERIASASCLLHPSEREGYGQVVIEAVSLGTPAVLVRGPENAAVELIEEGVNGFVAESADPEAMAEAIRRVIAGGPELRSSTLDWYQRHRDELSIESSLREVELAYDADAASGER